AEISRSVAKKVQAFETSEGAGATVPRSIGSMNLHRLDPFIDLDILVVSRASGMNHLESSNISFKHVNEPYRKTKKMKGDLRVRPLPWLCSGVGRIMPVHGPGLPNPTGLQLWIDLPKADKMTAPSYQELVSSQVPTAYPLGPDGPAEVKVISGKSFGVESPVRHVGGCWYLDIKLKANGEGKAEFFQDIPLGWTAFLYTIEGLLGVNNQSIEKYYTVVLSAEENEAGILLSLDGDQDARAVLIAGAPLNQPVFQYGPFVMNSKEEIMATLRDYDGQRNGFEKSKTWKSSIGGR
ncbi:hypothetical protein M407DRAFT_66543, partial [Tulasnella calospora MUT 4182]